MFFEYGMVMGGMSSNFDLEKTSASVSFSCPKSQASLDIVGCTLNIFNLNL